MSKVIFQLFHDDQAEPLGLFIFNGNFVFQLSQRVNQEFWNQIGFIKVDEGSREIASDQLFDSLNARLPIDLRNASKQDKIDYIRKTELRVASDSFFLRETDPDTR